MAWVTKRTINLNGAGTLFDPDPQLTQPGEFALDGQTGPIPLSRAEGGVTWAVLFIVDSAGLVQPVGIEKFEIAFVKRTTVDGRGYGWSRGTIPPSQQPGIELVQDGIQGSSLGVWVVVAGEDVPLAPARLQIRVWEGPR